MQFVELACRVYETESGLHDVPAADQLLEVICKRIQQRTNVSVRPCLTGTALSVNKTERLQPS